MSLIQCKLKYVAFLHILDIDEQLSNAEESSQLIEHIYSSIKSMLSLSSKSNKNAGIVKAPDISIYAEKIIISYSDDVPLAAELLIRDCIYLYVLLLKNGILLGGVLSLGELYHNKNVVYGPVFNKVKPLINVNRSFPKIIIDQTAIDIKQATHLYKQDEDGTYFIDIINNLQYIEEHHVAASSIFTENLSYVMTKRRSNQLEYTASLQWLHQYLTDSSIIEEIKQ